MTRRQRSSVIEPGSSPPAVLSEMVGCSGTSMTRPACRHRAITGEVSGQHPITSVRGETSFKYDPIPPINPPPPTATNTASSSGIWRSSSTAIVPCPAATSRSL
jgi:hypothetical protein